MKKNAGYAKSLVEMDKATAELAKIQEKNASLKGPAKEKEKVNEAPYVAKVTELQAGIDATEKELAKGYAAYEKAINAEGEDLNLIQEMANFHYMQRHYSAAAETWKRLITKGKDSEDNYLQIGKAYYQGKDFDKADEIFNQMIAKYPDYLPAYLWSANNAAAKDPDAKLGIGKQKFTLLLEKASADSVKNAEGIYNALRYLGFGALQSGNFEQARAYYNRMSNLDPKNNEMVIRGYSSLVSLYLQMGEYGRATEYNNKILSLDPANETAKSSIKYITALQSSAKPKASPNEITGVIKDGSGQPIAGASVRVKDTAAEAWTNAKGEYRFTMPEASTTLVISAKDYKSKEIPVTKVRVYNATLSK
jgi:tetratricopeptide (TPR) repeat protein